MVGFLHNRAVNQGRNRMCKTVWLILVQKPMRHKSAAFVVYLACVHSGNMWSATYARQWNCNGVSCQSTEHEQRNIVQRSSDLHV